LSHNETCTSQKKEELPDRKVNDLLDSAEKRRKEKGPMIPSTIHPEHGREEKEEGRAWECGTTSYM